MSTINENEEKIDNKSLVIEEENFKVKLISKFQEIDGLYKKSLSQYRQGLQEYTIEIKTLKNEISLKEQILQSEEKKILLVESSLLHDEKSLEKFHAKLFQKIDSLYELQHEYKKLLEADKFEESMLRKEGDITELLIEIEEHELILLNKELERLNLLALFSPKKKELNELNLKMEKLEAQKSYFESSDLEESNLLPSNQGFIEDVEVVAE